MRYFEIFWRYFEIISETLKLSKLLQIAKITHSASIVGHFWYFFVEISEIYTSIGGPIFFKNLGDPDLSYFAGNFLVYIKIL